MSVRVWFAIDGQRPAFSFDMQVLPRAREVVHYRGASYEVSHVEWDCDCIGVAPVPTVHLKEWP